LKIHLDPKRADYDGINFVSHAQFANEDSSSYVPESAELAWERTLNFIDSQLK